MIGRLSGLNGGIDHVVRGIEHRELRSRGGAKGEKQKDEGFHGEVGTGMNSVEGARHAPSSNRSGSDTGSRRETEMRSRFAS
jgi:hypothetical protein